MYFIAGAGVGQEVRRDGRSRPVVPLCHRHRGLPRAPLGLHGGKHLTRRRAWATYPDQANVLTTKGFALCRGHFRRGESTGRSGKTHRKVACGASSWAPSSSVMGGNGCVRPVAYNPSCPLAAQGGGRAQQGGYCPSQHSIAQGVLRGVVGSAWAESGWGVRLGAEVKKMSNKTPTFLGQKSQSFWFFRL